MNQLVETPAVRSIALAVRAELYVRVGKADPSTADMRQALSIAKKDPRVRMHCAVALAVAGNMRAAEFVYCDAVVEQLKQGARPLGNSEVISAPALAISYVTAWKPVHLISEHAESIRFLAANRGLPPNAISFVADSGVNRRNWRTTLRW